MAIILPNFALPFGKHLLKVVPLQEHYPAISLFTWPIMAGETGNPLNNYTHTNCP